MTTDDTTTTASTEEVMTITRNDAFPADLEGLRDLVRVAVEHGGGIAPPLEVGDYGLAVPLPPGWSLATMDLRQFETDPRIPAWVSHLQPLVGVDSFTAYVDEYRTADTRVYLADVFGKGIECLVRDVGAAHAIIDDHPTTTTDTERDVGTQAHRAEMVLRPTTAARRWGQAFTSSLPGGKPLTQEAFLELVTDGIAEIVEPDGSVLRELIANLHAIRTAEITSIVRTGGRGSIQLGQNVDLSAGTGDAVPFPEVVQVRLQPWAEIDEQVLLPVRVTPKVTEKHVAFRLDAPTLDDALTLVLAGIAQQIAADLDIVPLRVP